MSVNKIDIKYKQGTNLRKLIEFFDDNDAVLDMTGYTLQGKVKQNYGETTVIANFTFDLTDLITGKVYISLPRTFYRPILTVVLPCVYDVELVHPDGFVEDLFGGKFLIFPKV